MVLSNKVSSGAWRSASDWGGPTAGDSERPLGIEMKDGRQRRGLSKQCRAHGVNRPSPEKQIQQERDLKELAHMFVGVGRLQSIGQAAEWKLGQERMLQF